MFVLYKKENNTWSYADIWISEDGKIGYEHTGALGTKGTTQQINFEINKNLNPQMWVEMKKKQYRDQGFDEANEGDLSVVVLQFPVQRQLVEKIENANDEEREEILSKIDNNSDYDKLSIALTSLSYDNGYFPGFDGFDLGYNDNDKPVINIYLYGLDGKNYAELVKNYLVNEMKLDSKIFSIAYALADDEEENDKFTIISGDNNFSI